MLRTHEIHKGLTLKMYSDKISLGLDRVNQVDNVSLYSLLAKKIPCVFAACRAYEQTWQKCELLLKSHFEYFFFQNNPLEYLIAYTNPRCHLLPHRYFPITSFLILHVLFIGFHSLIELEGLV